MGCVWSNSLERNSLTREEAVDSAFARDDDDIANYMYQRLDGAIVGKTPGQLNGEDFIIEDCKNSTVYLFDHTAAVTIDDCKNCQIFIGPCKGSVFIRDCSQCVLVVSCQQFRTRDCHQCTVYLHCASQPVIESSSVMKFGCFQCHYDELKDQFQAAKLSVFNSNWFSIHNFTPEVDNSWSIIAKEEDIVPVQFPLPHSADLASKVHVTFEPMYSDVPLLWGQDNVPAITEKCLIVFFTSSDVFTRALKFVQEISQTKVYIVMTKELYMTVNMFSGICTDDTQSILPQKGQTVFIEICGEECRSICEPILSSLSPVYWSRDDNHATNDIQSFHQLINEQIFGMH